MLRLPHATPVLTLRSLTLRSLTLLTLALAPSVGPASAPVQTLAQAPVPREEPVNRALLIGIENYDPDWGWASLTGPKRDALALRDALVVRAGFRPEHIATLFDGQATRRGILQALDDLADAAGPGDLLLVFFAGHGSQIPDDDGDEFDGWDESLVPIDAVAPDGTANDIRDDDLQAFIDRANRKTDNLVFLFDCCSSGTNVRGDTGSVSRYVSPQQRGFTGTRVGSGTPGNSQDNSHSAPPAAASGYFPDRMSYVALSACRSDQMAFETTVDTSHGPAVHGIFTWSVVRELFDLAPEMSYGDLLKRVRRRVTATHPEQTPVIEGPLDRRLLFGGRSVVQEPFLELQRRGERWELSGGTLLGLAAGSELAVCDDRAPADTADRRVGRVRIEDVGPLRSDVSWVEGPAPSVDRDGVLRAFLGADSHRTGALGVRLITDDADARAALAAALANAKAEAVRVAGTGDPDVSIVLGPDSAWTVSTPEGVVLPIRARAQDPAEVERLVRALVRLGRARILAHALGGARGDIAANWELLLTTDGEQTALAWPSAVAAEAGGDAAATAIAPARRTPTRLVDGQVFAVRVTNASTTGVWATLLSIAPDGEVQQVWRSPEDEPIPPGRQRETLWYPLSLTQGAEAFYLSGTQRFVGLVTHAPLDFSAFQQAPVTDIPTTRGGSPQPPRAETSVADLLGDSFGVTCFDMLIAPAGR